MERDVLVLIARIVWTLENVIPWLLAVFAVLLMIGAALFVDWVIDRRKG